jgi:hypothetical protein
MEVPPPLFTQELPDYLLPLRAWSKLVHEDIEGARQDMKRSIVTPGVSKTWKDFVARVNEGLANPQTRWLVFTQIQARFMKRADIETQAQDFLKSLDPAGADLLTDTSFRWPVLILLAEARLKRQDERGARTAVRQALQSGMPFSMLDSRPHLMGLW